MSVGVKALDDEHKKIIFLINKLYSAMDGGYGVDVLSEIFVALFRYVSDHYAREESLLQRTEYPDSLAHEQEHADLYKEVESLFARYLAHQNCFLVIDVLALLCSMLKRPGLQTDMKYKEHLHAHGIK